MDKKSPDEKKPAVKKKAAPKKTAPYPIINNTNLFGWIFSCFVVCGCMFFLGVMVGRNTAPVQFDVDRLVEKLSGLPASVLNPEKKNIPEIPPTAPIETMEIPLINDAIIDQLKDRGNPPEIYEQYVPPVLTPKYAKTPPVLEKPSSAPMPETNPETTPDTKPDKAPAESVAMLKPETAPVSVIPAPELRPKPLEEAAAVPPPPPPSPPPPGPAKRMDSGSDFAIQVASLKDSEKARLLMNRFRANGYPAFCQSSAVDGVTWHRVRIGPYPDRTLADRDQERLKAAGVDSLVIAMPQITR